MNGVLDDGDLVDVEFDLSQRRTHIQPISNSDNHSTDQPINQSTDRPINQSTDQPINQWIDLKVRLLSANTTKVLALTKSSSHSTSQSTDNQHQVNDQSTNQSTSQSSTDSPVRASRCFTGLACYTGAQVLASLAAQRPTLFNQTLQQALNQSTNQSINQSKPMKILELGCGIGLSGIIIVQQAFRDAVSQPYLLLTDGEEEAVKLSSKNIERTFSQSNQSINQSSHMSVIQALWSDQGRQKVVDHMKQVLHLNDDDQSIKFDLIYGTDLLYAKTSLRSIIDFSFPLLSECGMLLLAHAPRSHGLHEQLQSLNHSIYQSGQCDDNSPLQEASCHRTESQWCVQLKMFYIKMNSFLDDDTIKQFQWYGVDVCVICRLSEYPNIKQRLELLGLSLQSVSDIERSIAELEDEEGGLMGLHLDD